MKKRCCDMIPFIGWIEADNGSFPEKNVPFCETIKILFHSVDEPPVMLIKEDPLSHDPILEQ